MVAAAVAASFLVLPGYALVAFVKRPVSAWARLLDAIVWSIFLTSAIFWLWPLHALRLDTWFFVCLGMSALGLAIAIGGALLRLVRRQIGFPKTERLALLIAIVAVSAFILVNLIVRPSIDWDAVNYYFFVAIGFSNANHVGMTLPTSIIITPNTPNGITPLMPTIYALAIEGAAFFRETTEAAVHLIPFVFFVGTLVATRQLASRFMTSVAADAAALFVAVMPAMINYYVGNPLYVDGLTVFLLAALANELYRFGSDWLQGPRIGALLTLIILSKANGFVLIAFVAVVVVAGALKQQRGRILAAIFALGLIAVAAILHEYDTVSSVGLWIAIPLTLFGCIAFVTPMQIQLRGAWRELLWIAIFTVPGAFYMYALSKASGSPAGFFVPSLIHVATPNYQWALKALSLGALYSTASQPGLPQNYAPGLLLWWGFSPFINVLAIVGAVFAYRQMPRVRPIVLLILFFYVGFLTIFNLTSFRHLLPVLPFLAVLAAFGLSRLLHGRAEYIAWSTLAVVTLSVPFAWTAQLGMYLPPLPWLSALSLDPYHALSNRAMLWTFLFVVSICAGAIVLRKFARLTSMAPRWADLVAIGAFVASACFILYADIPLAIAACVVGLFASSVVSKRWDVVNANAARWALPAAAIVTAGIVFEPLIAAAISPGLAAQSAAVKNNEDLAYVPALQTAMAMGSGQGSILTYQGYGVSWYSSGRYRRIDLTDAFDLGAMRTAVQTLSAERFLHGLASYDAFAAILPAPGTRKYESYSRMRAAANLPGLYALDDPLLAPIEYRSDAWAVHHILDVSTSFDSRARVSAVTSHGAVNAIFVRIPGSSTQDDATIAVRASILDAGKAAIANFTYVVPNAKAGSDEIRVHDLIANALRNSGIESEAAYLRIDAVEYKASGNDAKVFDWRSPHFILARHGARWTILGSNMPFYLHPEIAPVAYIQLRGADLRKADALTLYPGAVKGDAQTLADILTVGLRFSSRCPKGSLMQVDADVSGHALHQRGHAGEVVTFAMNKFFGVPSDGTNAIVSSVTVRGLQKNCAVSERLAAPQSASAQRLEITRLEIP